MNPEPTQDETTNATPAPAIPSTAGMTTKVVKGSLWTLAGQVAPLGVSLFTTPFVIRLLGSEGYGVLILVGLIPTYFAFADLGMGIASTKFASEAYAAGDAKREASTVHTAAAMSFILSVPVAALIFIFSNTAVGLFNVPEHLRGEANLALKIASVTFVLNFLNSIFNTPQLTRLRMDLNTFVSSGFRMLGLIATPITIYLGGGIVGAVAVLLAVSILTLAANIAVSGKLLRELFTFTLNRNAIRPMLKFGGALVLAGLSMLLLINIEKAIISIVESPDDLAYYSVAFTLASMLTMLSSSMVQSLLPAFSQLQEPANKAQLESLYERILRILLVGMIPSFTILAVGAEPFFAIWAGPEFGVRSYPPFLILLGGAIVYILGYIPSSILYASGRSSTIAKLYWVELIAYIPLIWSLTNSFGINGAAFGWSIRAVGDALMLFILVDRLKKIHFPFRQLAKLFVLLISAIVFIFVCIQTEFWMKWSLVTFATGLYIIVTWKWILYPEELFWVKSHKSALHSERFR